MRLCGACCRVDYARGNAHCPRLGLNLVMVGAWDADLGVTMAGMTTAITRIPRTATVRVHVAAAVVGVGGSKTRLRFACGLLRPSRSTTTERSCSKTRLRL